VRIVLRKKDGSVLEVPEGTSFIELRNGADQVAAVVYSDSQERVHLISDPASKQAGFYSKMFKAEFAKDTVKLGG
jgi:hypothetical protein